jgi:Contractile injection system tube protein
VSLANSPKLIKGGLVVLNQAGTAVARSIALQYNPDSLSRSFQVQGAGGEGGGERATPFRLKGPAIETLKVEAEIDASDGLEFPDQNPNVVALGIGPQLALLESLVNPTSDALVALNALASSGVLEIVPPDAPLVLFVWGRQIVVPVRVTDFSITEEAFDPVLNPVRAKVSLGLRVMSTDDLGFSHRGGALFMAHLRRREQLAGKVDAATLSSLGLNGLP